MLLYLTALKPTDAVSEGFLPAAERLGLPVVLLTDQVAAHLVAYRDRSFPPPTVVGCDVRDPRAVLDAVHRVGPPAGLLSNSDHLQVATALAADYLGLPGKDWRAALRCRDKALMRRAVAAAGLDAVAAVSLAPGEEPGPAAAQLPFPVVLKPRDGVASEDVRLAGDPAEIAARVAEVRGRRPGVELLVEEFLPGPLHTFESLGDGRDLAALGGWQTTPGPPPAFVEQALDWAPALPAGVEEALRAQLAALGVGFGACHTEFVLAGGRPRLVEVNDRLIGDRMDLVLADLLGVPLFEHVIEVYLGRPLPALPDPRAVPRHARVEYACAERAGTLVAAPGPTERCHDGVRLWLDPMRPVGTTNPLHGSNRDYLAALRAIGPDAQTVRRALAAFRAGLRWEIRPARVADPAAAAAAGRAGR